jgi:zinc protease
VSASRFLRVAAAFLCAAAASCSAPGPTRISTPASGVAPGSSSSAEPTASATPLSEPPPPGVATVASFPSVIRRSLDGGAELWLVTRHDLPLLSLTALFRSGGAADGASTGSAEIAAELVRAQSSSPAKLAEFGALGATLEASVDRDSTRFTLKVFAADRARAVSALIGLVRAPNFVPADFTRAQEALADRANARAGTDAHWAVEQAALRELFALPTSVHPYARFPALGDELSSVTLDQARTFAKNHYAPQNLTLIAVGDTSIEALEPEVKAALAGWKGAALPELSVGTPDSAGRLRILLVNQPERTSTELALASLGPERRSPAWPVWRTTAGLLAGPLGRLERTRKQGAVPAWRSSAELVELVRGPTALLLRAAGPESATETIARALLAEFDRLAKEAPSAEETNAVTHALASGFALESNGVDGITSLLTKARLFGAEPDQYDSSPAELLAVNPEAIARLTALYLRADRSILVVAGNAERLGPALQALGRVEIVNPNRRFSVEKTLEYAPRDPKN